MLRRLCSKSHGRGRQGEAINAKESKKFCYFQHCDEISMWRSFKIFELFFTIFMIS
jgi:hypothetical protein